MQLVIYRFGNFDKSKNIKFTFFTLYSWNKRLILDPAWQYYNHHINYGLYNRIFTEKKEKSHVDFIGGNIIQKHHHFSDRNYLITITNNLK